MTGPTPQPKMTSPGASGEKNEGAVIQRVIHEVGGGPSYPMLTKTNYSNWTSLMKVKLKARVLWTAVEASVNPQEDT